MILDLADRATEDIFNGADTKAARTIPRPIWNVAARKLDMLHAAHELRDLAVPPANRLEELKGARAGFHSIRINDQYRVMFRWKDGNASGVQIVDYH